jgi:hypothetical protein
MKKKPGVQQLELIPRSKNPLVVIDPNHRLVRLTETLDWLRLEEKAQEIRMQKLKSHAGRPPDLRVNLGAVIFMSVNRLTYREAEDQIRHYAPARYLCGLTDSLETPDHTTINDFMLLMGNEGMAELNTLAVRMAVERGFGDPGVLVADTTAQQAPIGYPTEVGLLGSFFRSISRLTKQAGNSVRVALKSVQKKLQQGGKHLRTYHLFAKTKQERRSLTTKAVHAAKAISKKLGEAVKKSAKGRLKGSNKAAQNRLENLLTNMDKLIPQIEYWLEQGFVAKNKIVNLSMPLLRSIPRGKIGKDVEFGIKWGIQRIGGGFVLGQADPSRGNFNDQPHVRESIGHHIDIFEEAPASFAYDRGGWSERNNAYLKEVGVRHNAIAPKGKAKWSVTGRIKEKLVKERARIEGDIGSIKCSRYGFDRPAARSEEMMVACGHRAMLGYNLNKLVRLQAAVAGMPVIG